MTSLAGSGAPWVGRGGSLRVYDDPAAAVGVMGPQAITQLAAAMGPVLAEEIFGALKLTRHLTSPPTAPVPQREVFALHAALRARLGEAGARFMARDAGERTAAELLAEQIPQVGRMALRLLPRAIAARFLLSTIEKYGWSFCGSDGLRVLGGPPWKFQVSGCVLCRGARSAGPICDFYLGCFEKLFQALIHPTARVVMAECVAAGAGCCTFDVLPKVPAE